MSDRVDVNSGKAASKRRVQLPQSMMRVMADEFGRLYTQDAADSFARKAREMQRRGGSREANRYLLGKLGTDLSDDNDEGYYAEALNYHLALLHAQSRQPEQMAQCIAQSKTMPAPRDSSLFSDHVTLSIVTRAQQQSAIEREIPSFLFACMPHSASGTLTSALARLLDIPVVHVTLGRFPQYFLAPAWLEMFMEGGAITHDHFPANDFNSGVLANRGRLDVFVIVRDPRAAAHSAVRHAKRSDASSPEPLDEAIAKECIANFIPWLQGWIARAQDPAVPFKIHWVTHQEIKNDLPGVTRRVCSVMEASHPALGRVTRSNRIEDVGPHDAADDDTAWRTDVNDKWSAEMWSACTPHIRELLALES